MMKISRSHKLLCEIGISGVVAVCVSVQIRHSHCYVFFIFICPVAIAQHGTDRKTTCVTSITRISSRPPAWGISVYI